MKSHFETIEIDQGLKDFGWNIIDRSYDYPFFTIPECRELVRNIGQN